MDWENIIAEAERLVETKEKSEEHVFVEPELGPLVFGLLDKSDSIPEEMYDRVSKLFIGISSMHKSTPFGYSFYKKLMDTDLPFNRKVFEHAAEREPYYNCEGDAVTGLVVTLLKNMGTYEDDDTILENMSLRDPPDSISHKKKIDRNSPLYQSIKDKISYLVGGDASFMKLNAGLKAAVYLELHELSGIIEEKLRENILKLKDFTQPGDKDRFLSVITDDTISVAYSLYHLTGNPKYRKITDLLENEYSNIIDAGVGKIENYHERFSAVYNKILRCLSD